MKWTVVFTSRAERDLTRLDEKTATRVVSALDRLADNRGGDVLKLKGRTDQWRLRVGGYRVLFSYNSKARQIVVLHILHRSEAY